MPLNVQVSPQLQPVLGVTGSSQPSNRVGSGSTPITASSTCTADDNGLLFINNTSSNFTKTIPQNIGTDFCFEMAQGSTGTVGILAGTGVTLVGATTTTSAQGQILRITQSSPNVYIVNILAAGQDLIFDSSGNLVLSNGTANGVLYLNGSKAVTSGSVLTFDGTNLGLGVTPSGWSSIKAFQVGTAASFSGGSGFNDAFVTSNAYYDGANWKYINTNSAYYASVGGAAAARWYTAPVGVNPGDTIPFTQAMTLDASGNLLVGTTSATGSVSNNAEIIGGVVNTYNGTASISTSPTTVVTLPSRDGATYIFSCQNISDAGTSTYGAVSIITQQTTALVKTDLQTATYTVITVSGLDIKITSTLATKTYRWSLIRIM